MTKEDVQKDLEGLRIMRVLGANMAWLMKALEAGRAAAPIPSRRPRRRQTYPVSPRRLQRRAKFLWDKH